jgi:predicted oxidoreductase
MEKLQSDVVIVGGGIAGIVCALELLPSGARVLVLDRDLEENFGGLAKESFGGMFFVGTPEQRRAKVIDSPEAALADWREFAQFGADDEWPRRWAEAYVNECTARVYDWLKRLGVRYFPVPHWVERGLHTRGNSAPRFHMVWGTGQELVRVLVKHLLAHPMRGRLKLRFGYRVERLIRANGTVTGCAGHTEAAGVPFEAEAECVVIAAGGLNGSIERVKANWHRDWSAPPATILNGSHRYADGTLHDAARAAGAAVTHLDRMWNYAAGVHHWAPRKPGHGLSLVPPRSALWLDARGERIGPQPLITGFDTRDLVTRICERPGGYSWQILNRRIALKELAVSGAEFNPSIRNKSWLGFGRDLVFGNRWLYDQLTRNCVDFVTGNSLDELVYRMNVLAGKGTVNADAVRRAVSAYDETVVQGAPWRDEQLARIALMKTYRGDRIRTASSQRILDPDAKPLVAIREFIISRKSLGGIRTDLQSRALGGDGAPVPGLYAIGEAAGFGGGGMHGLRALEGTFLGGCVLTARAAAAAIAGSAGGARTG